MNNKHTKITLPALVNMVADATNTTVRVSELFLNELFVTISQSLVNEETVTIDGLGTFGIEYDNKGRNGKTRCNPVFTLSQEFADKVNEPFAAFTSEVLSDDVDEVMLNAVEQEPTPAVEQEPTPTVEQEPTPAVEQEPTPAVEQEPTPAVEQEPTPTVEQEPVPAVEQEPVSAVEQEPMSAVEQEPTPEVEEPAAESSQAMPVSLKQPVVDNHRFLWGFITGFVTAAAVAAACWFFASSPRGISGNVAQDDTPVDTAHVDTVTVAPTTPVVTEVATNTMYLTRMSSKHYGKPDFWVYIYEENKELISDPNNVPPGTVLVIPPKEKYGIDPDNPESVREARVLQYRIFTGEK